MKRSLELVSQLIVIAEEKDRAWRELHRKLNKSSQSIGEDAITFHLRRLKELLEEEAKEYTPVNSFQLSLSTGTPIPLPVTGVITDRPILGQGGASYPLYIGT